jgi:undecaprenyl-diphosphatase
MRVDFHQKILQFDEKFTKRLSIANKPGPLRRIAILFAHSGDSWFWGLGLVLLWWLGDETWKARAVAMILGIFVTAILVFIIKFTVRRKRPAGDWGNVYRKTDPHSFPSGHAARVAMLAVVAVGLGPAWFGILLLTWAPLVILARVAMGVHYLSDVLAGALLGVAIGMGILIFIPRLAILL